MPDTDNYDDPSSKIWSVYLSEATLHDKALVDSWKSDMDGILIFSGLFSAIVTAFLIEGYKYLKPDSGDTAVTFLAHISQQLANASNGSSTQSLTPPATFQPTSSALRVNTFWFLSLIFGLICALMATLVQQWARNYLQTTERHPAPHKKARIRAFFYEGIERFGMANMVEAIPTLLHVAVFLFFAGLVDFLFSINETVAYAVLWAVIVSILLYVIITIIPIIRSQCPFSTPLSSICWRIIQILGLLQYGDSWTWIGPHRIKGSMAQGREMLATQDLRGVYARDLRALQWTMESLNEDNRLEPFVEGISQVLSTPGRESSPLTLPGMFGAMRELLLDPEFDLFARIVKLLMTTQEPGTIAEAQRRKRAIACMNVIDSLVRLVNAAEPASVAWLNRGNHLADLALALTALQMDSVSVIAATAKRAKTAVVRRLQTEIIEAMHGYRELEWSHRTTTRVLDILDRLDSIESILDAIPTVASSPHFSTQYKDIIQILRTLYIPKRLHKKFDHSAVPSSERQAQIVTCLKSVFATASDVHPAYSPHSFASTTDALVELRHDDAIPIVLVANCTAIRLAWHIQCDIIELVCRHNVLLCSPVEYDFIPVYRSLLHSLDVLDSLNDTDVKRNLQQQLMLGVSNEGSEWARWDIITEFVGRGDQQLAGYLSQMSSDELKRLEEFQLSTTGGTTTKDFALPGKIVLSQGKTVILIAFLKAMVASPLPDETLELILDTLRLLTRNLTARFSSHTAQTLLVELIGTVKNNLAADLFGQAIPEKMDDAKLVTRNPVIDSNRQGHVHSPKSQDLIVEIIQTLFSVLGTIGDPELINDAKAIVKTVIDDSQVLKVVRDAAADSFQKLEETTPFVFMLYHPSRDRYSVSENIYRY